MKVQNIEDSVLNACISLLRKSVSGITPISLVRALENYDENAVKPVIPQLTLSEAKKALGVTYPTLKKLWESGKIKRIAYGRIVRIDRVSVEKFLQNAE